MKNTIISRLNVSLMCSVALFTVFFTTVVSAKEYTFSWAENNGLVEGYRLYYKEGGVASAPFEGITANEGCSPIDIGNETSFTISGLAENETYHFTLTAYAGDEESAFTQVITASPEDEKLVRWKLAFPIILDFLLDSDS